MKRVTFYLVFLFAFLPLYASTLNLNTQFTKANKLYNEKKYKEALKVYNSIKKSLEKKDLKSFKLYFNLGCTYYRLNDIANSRLYFEKAKRIHPLNKELETNLSLIVSKLKDREKNIKDGFFVAFFKKIYLSFSLNTLTILSILFFFMIFIFIAMLLSGRFDKKKSYYGIGVSLLLFLIFFSLFYSRYQFTFAKEGIVFSQTLEVFSEPNTSSTVLFKIHKGTKVKEGEEINGYVHIYLPDGLNGWIDKQYLKDI